MTPSEAWEDEYRRKRALWTGRPHTLPDLPAGTKVLELGCGNGKTLLPMVRHGWEVTGLDFSPRALELAGEELDRCGLKAELVLADVKDLPFDADSFGAIFAYHVLEHIPTPERRLAVTEALRVLARGGKLYVRTFSTNDMRFGAGREVGPDTFERGTGIVTRYFQPRDVEELLSCFGSLKVYTESREAKVGGETKLREWIVGEGEK